MISPKFFIDTLGSYGIDFFAGVPDSLLKNVCAYIADNKDAKHNVIAANEGATVGLAAGYHLATVSFPIIVRVYTRVRGLLGRIKRKIVGEVMPPLRSRERLLYVFDSFFCPKMKSGLFLTTT